MKVLLVVCALVGSVMMKQLEPGSNIHQCNRFACPPMTVTQVTEKYEVRQYTQSNWAGSSEAEDSTFYALLDYISGENAQSQKMDMTAPVLNRMCDEITLFCTEVQTTYFYLATPDPPAPTAEDVFLTEMPNLTVYVRAFDGFNSMTEITDHKTELEADLQAAGISFRSDVWMYAGYDSPFNPFKRRDEVWIVGQ